MNRYNATINPAAYSLEWLQARRAELARIGLGGQRIEKQSVNRKAELTLIDADLKRRGEQPQQVARARVLPVEPNDTARPRFDWPPVEAPRPQGISGYSQAFQSVSADYSPAPYSQYR